MNEEIKKIEEFLLLVRNTKFENHIQPYAYYKVEETNERGVNAIAICDEEHYWILVVKSFNEFLSWYLKDILTTSFKNGQNSIRKGVKEILNLTV